jgi:hypothetical protein
MHRSCTGFCVAPRLIHLPAVPYPLADGGMTDSVMAALLVSLRLAPSLYCDDMCNNPKNLTAALRLTSYRRWPASAVSSCRALPTTGPSAATVASGIAVTVH